MTIVNKIAELKFIIGRFDHYFDSINNKGNLYLTLNTFILGGSLGGFTYLDHTYHFNQWIILLLLIPALFANLAAFVYTLSAIRPFTRRHDNKDISSSLFFMDVSNQTASAWAEKWEGFNEEEWKTDLEIQSRLLAVGLSGKFKCLSNATLFIGIQIACIIFFSFFLFLKY